MPGLPELAGGQRGDVIRLVHGLYPLTCSRCARRPQRPHETSRPQGPHTENDTLSLKYPPSLV